LNSKGSKSAKKNTTQKKEIVGKGRDTETERKALAAKNRGTA
jgi:hypothetical protein